MEAVKTIQYKNHIINIIPDEFYNSDTMLGEDEEVFLLYYHRDFYIKKDGFPEPKSNEDIKALKKDYFLFIVYAYIHSGVSLSLGNDTYPFNDQWDVSNCGYVLIKKDSGIDKPREAAQSLIDEYNDVLSGNVYGYQVTFNDEVTDSCWGFVGDIDKSGIIDEAKGIIDYNVEHNKEKFAEQLTLEL
jgi:hypothetical protein